MSDLVSVSITHMCGGELVIETWEVPYRYAVNMRALHGEPYARTVIPGGIEDKTAAIKSGEFTTWNEGEA